MTEELRKSYDGSDFTWDSYREILQKAKSEYEFRFYDDFSKQKKFLLLRHDVDFSIHAALRMAKIEAEEGIRSTYFLLPHCIFYNLLEKEITGLIQEISDLGHRFGLHFDSHYYGIEKKEELDRHIEKELGFLRDMIGIEVSAFSFHNTTPFTMECREWTYGGLINTYAEYFQNEVTYCSDSNGYWRHSRPMDILDPEINPRVQLLTHPAWWHERLLYPRQKIYRCAYGRAKATMKSYDATLEKFERLNLDGQTGNLQFFRHINVGRYRYLKHLYNIGNYKSLYSELWHIKDQALLSASLWFAMFEWGVSLQDVKRIAVDRNYMPSPEEVFETMFERKVHEILDVAFDLHRQLYANYLLLLRGGDPNSINWEEACKDLSDAVLKLYEWIDELSDGKWIAEIEGHRTNKEEAENAHSHNGTSKKIDKWKSFLDKLGRKI